MVSMSTVCVISYCDMSVNIDQAVFMLSSMLVWHLPLTESYCPLYGLIYQNSILERYPIIVPVLVSGLGL